MGKTDFSWGKFNLGELHWDNGEKRWSPFQSDTCNYGNYDTIEASKRGQIINRILSSMSWKSTRFRYMNYLYVKNWLNPFLTNMDIYLAIKLPLENKNSFFEIIVICIVNWRTFCVLVFLKGLFSRVWFKWRIMINYENIVLLAKSENSWQPASWHLHIIAEPNFEIAWLCLKLSKNEFNNIWPFPFTTHFGKFVASTVIRIKSRRDPERVYDNLGDFWGQ